MIDCTIATSQASRKTRLKRATIASCGLDDKSIAQLKKRATGLIFATVDARTLFDKLLADRAVLKTDLRNYAAYAGGVVVGRLWRVLGGMVDIP